MKHFLRLCSVLGLLVVVSTGMWGQSTDGAIQGTVVDPSGATLAGATVTAQEHGDWGYHHGDDDERRRVCTA